ncbi:hypothetical protein Dimus_014610 [Dionaea muscipula]
MASNKFANLYTQTNRITLVLVYAALEWTLIFLLLLNSLFSYLLTKFASHFGLKKPCILCSRIDRIFEPQNPNSFYTSLVCEDHAAEIGKLGYCSNHRKLVETQNLCLDCSSSSSSQHLHREGISTVANGEVNCFKCWCCDLIIPQKNDSSHHEVIRPSLDAFGDAQKSDLATNQREYEPGIDDMACDLDPKGEEKNPGSEGFSLTWSSRFGYQILESDEREDLVLEAEAAEPILDVDAIVAMKTPSFDDFGEVSPTGVLPRHLDFYIEDYQLVPVESIESVAREVNSVGGEENQRAWDLEEPHSPPLLDLVKLYEDSSVFQGQELDGQAADSQATQVPSTADDSQEPEESALPVPASGITPTSGDAYQATNDEGEVEIGCGQPVDPILAKEVDPPPAHDVFQVPTSSDEIPPDCKQIQEENLSCKDASSVENGDRFALSSEQEDRRTLAIMDHDSKQIEDKTEKYKDMLVDIGEHGLEDNKVAFHREINEAEAEEEEIEKKLLLLATEELLDHGSIMSEIEGDGDGAAATVEQLKSALRTERMALSTLYAELEEERNAAAVATNQTMAMINRLQEEKAAMQMEALHNQRMMEEQAEYDQEALQMMNEVIVKREMEKQELEKELEIYKKKAMDYEERERIRILAQRRGGSSSRSRTSSASFSNAEESDGSSIDLNGGDQAKLEEDVSANHDETTPMDTVQTFHDSLASFEEERLSILQQLKVLEEKLFTLADEEEEHFTSMKPFQKFYEENCVEEFRELVEEADGVDRSGFSPINGDPPHQRELETFNGSVKPKQLLPLFNATDFEFEDGELNEHEHDLDDSVVLHKSPPITKFELEKKRLVIEEEVGHVYERLEALEADREFLKHCVGSLRKGDKGLELLQEILQHLHDLKNVELQARNLTNVTFL